MSFVMDYKVIDNFSFFFFFANYIKTILSVIYCTSVFVYQMDEYIHSSYFRKLVIVAEQPEDLLKILCLGLSLNIHSGCIVSEEWQQDNNQPYNIMEEEIKHGLKVSLTIPSSCRHNHLATPSHVLGLRGAIRASVRWQSTVLLVP